MIDRLTLRNFKAFARLDLALAPLTLLSGTNAVGKSTVLQALAVLRQSYDAGTLADEGLLLNGELVSLGIGQDLLHEDYRSDDDGPEIDISIGQAGRDYGWSVRYGQENDLLQIADKPEYDLAEMTLFHRGFQYLRADRVVPAVSYPKSYEAAIRRGFLGVTGEHAVNFLRVHQDSHSEVAATRHPNAPSSSLLDQVTAWMQEICPGVNIQIHDLAGTDQVRLDYGFFGTAGISSSNRYRPTNVGFGLTYVLPIVLACVTARPGTVVLLENPEAHLHPRGQTLMGKLACLAAASGAQIIMESHSDHVLNGVRISVKEGIIPAPSVALHYFQRSGPGAVEVIKPTVGSDGMLSIWPDGFFDEWDRSLDDLLS